MSDCRYKCARNTKRSWTSCSSWCAMVANASSPVAEKIKIYYENINKYYNNIRFCWTCSSSISMRRIEQISASVSKWLMWIINGRIVSYKIVHKPSRYTLQIQIVKCWNIHKIECEFNSRKLWCACAKELIVQTLLILTNVDQKCACTSGKRAVITFVGILDVLYGLIDGWWHDTCPLCQVMLLQVRHQLFILAAATVLQAWLNQLSYTFHLCRRCLIFSIVECKSSIGGLQRGITCSIAWIQCRFSGLVDDIDNIVAHQASSLGQALFILDRIGSCILEVWLKTETFYTWIGYYMGWTHMLR